MALKKMLTKQAKENLYSKIIREGYAPSSILYSIDYEKGTLQMDIMKPKVNKQEKDLKSHEYDTINFTVDFDKFPLEDKIEWHRQVGNIVARDMIQTYINLKRLKMKMRKIENHVQTKKATNKAHLVSINDLEQKLIYLGKTIENTSNIYSMIKEKDKEIQNIIGKLNLPTSVHNLELKR
jgi:hypothetical protein